MNFPKNCLFRSFFATPFITKAEFDSLKNNFQSQIDQYNSSIDSKIDGAIAAYLAGIKISNSNSYAVENKSWGKVKEYNFEPYQEFTTPSFNFSFNYYFANYWHSGYHWYGSWWSKAKLEFNQQYSGYKNQVRNCIDAGDEKSNYLNTPEYIGWKGKSIDYQEKIIYAMQAITPRDSSGKDGKNNNGDYLLYMMANGGYWAVKNILKMKAGNTKYDDFMYSGEPYYNNDLSNYKYMVYEELNKNNELTKSYVNLRKVENEQYVDPHITIWKNITFNYLSDPSWQKTIGKNTLPENYVNSLSNLKKLGSWSVLQNGDRVFSTNAQPAASGNDSQTNHIYLGGTCYVNDDYQPSTIWWFMPQNYSNWYTGETANDSTDTFVSVGLLSNTWNTNKIMQWNPYSSTKYNYVREQNTEIKNMNLGNGYLVGTVKADETFEWEPVISGKYHPYLKDDYWTEHDYTMNGVTYHRYGDYCLDGACTNTADGHKRDVKQWKVVLATAYFGDKTNLINGTAKDGGNGKIIKEEDQTVDYKICENGKSVKFKFKADKDCIVVAKWFPDLMTKGTTTTALGVNDCYWYGTLDLDKCGTYKITSES